MAEQMLMKDGLGKAAISRIATGVAVAWPEFDRSGFEKSANKDLEALELKQRVSHLVKALHGYLPENFVEAAEILHRVPEHWDFGDANNPVRGFAAWPVIDYAAHYGLEQPEVSLDLLKRLTHLFSAEFAIRPFILRYPDLCFTAFDKWVEDPSHHVRRLVSEGSRPRLPWGIQLKPFCENPSALVPLLTRLNRDASDYVRRSVANSLNDISKDNPELAIEICRDWSDSASSETLWIIRHALRSLIKQGHPEVFPLLGFEEKPKIALGELKLESSRLQLGEGLVFEVELHSKAKNKQRLSIDFAIHHCKANGTRSAKVFKWKECDLKAGETLQISKRHPIKKITTRNYYSGDHQLDLIVNGKTLSSTAFYLDCGQY